MSRVQQVAVTLWAAQVVLAFAVGGAGVCLRGTWNHAQTAMLAGFCLLVVSIAQAASVLFGALVMGILEDEPPAGEGYDGLYPR